MNFLVDANVLSEATKPVPDSRAVAWLGHHESALVVSPIVLGELEYGVLLLPAGKRRDRLQDWFEKVVKRMRVLDFDAGTAATWAALLARLKKRGLAMPIKDSQIAATAIAHGLTVATRNTVDYKYAGVPLFNPFKS